MCCTQTTVPVRIHPSVGQTKEEGGKNRGQSQEASLKIFPEFWDSVHLLAGPVCVCVLAYIVYARI